MEMDDFMDDFMRRYSIFDIRYGSDDPTNIALNRNGIAVGAPSNEQNGPFSGQIKVLRRHHQQQAAASSTTA
eukprot:12416515-Ditylum_brightwellii.AAC.1